MAICSSDENGSDHTHQNTLGASSEVRLKAKRRAGGATLGGHETANYPSTALVRGVNAHPSSAKHFAADRFRSHPAYPHLAERCPEEARALIKRAVEESHWIYEKERIATHQLAMLVLASLDGRVARSAHGEDAAMTVACKTLANPRIFEHYDGLCPVLNYIRQRICWESDTDTRREAERRERLRERPPVMTGVLPGGDRMPRVPHEYRHGDWILESLLQRYFANAGAGRPAGLNAAFGRGLLVCMEDISAALVTLCQMKLAPARVTVYRERFDLQVDNIARHHEESLGERLRDCVHANRVREDRAFGVIEGVIDTTDAVFDRIEERRVSAAHRMLARGLAAQRTRLAREFRVAFHRAA